MEMLYRKRGTERVRAGKGIRKYERAAIKALVCSKTSRDRLTRVLRDSIRACLEETPDADYHLLVQAIGEPKRFARELLGGLAPEDVENAWDLRQTHRFFLAVAAAAVLVSVMGAVGNYYL